MNKYKQLLTKILKEGLHQESTKGSNKYLLNQVLSMSPMDIERILHETKRLAKSRLRSELDLYMMGETRVSEYQKVGISWWDYCLDSKCKFPGLELENSYPTYYKRLPKLIDEINRTHRASKNYVLFLGETGVPTNQQPCISMIHFQISEGFLNMSVIQRSADSNLGLPSDIYQMYLISKLIDIPLANITFFITNAHIYDNNLEITEMELVDENYKAIYNLNV